MPGVLKVMHYKALRNNDCLSQMAGGVGGASRGVAGGLDGDSAWPTACRSDHRRPARPERGRRGGIRLKQPVISRHWAVSGMTPCVFHGIRLVAFLKQFSVVAPHPPTSAEAALLSNALKCTA
jgi:hypothetical protein